MPLMRSPVLRKSCSIQQGLTYISLLWSRACPSTNRLAIGAAPSTTNAPRKKNGPVPAHDNCDGKEDYAQARLEPSRDGDSPAIFTSSLAGTFLDDPLDDRYCRKHIRPTSIKGQVRQHLRRFRSCQAVIHRSIEVIWDLSDLVCGNESADSNQAPVPRRQGRA